jgi:hypothetical protein
LNIIHENGLYITIGLLRNLLDRIRYFGRAAIVLAHDVFISYASYDKPTADATCAILESRRIHCWIAPRDILPGYNYAESIINAIEASKIVVLILSSGSNSSPQVMREIECAVSKGVFILPLRIEDIILSKSMEFYVSSQHWLDALTPPLERHLTKLAETIELILKQLDSHGSTPTNFMDETEVETGAHPFLKSSSTLEKRNSKQARFEANKYLLIFSGIAVIVIVLLLTGRWFVWVKPQSNLKDFRDNTYLANIYYNRGNILVEKGNYDQAIIYYQKSAIKLEKLSKNRTDISLERDLANIYNNIGEAFQNIGDTNQALEYNLKSMDIYEKITKNRTTKM